MKYRTCMHARILKKFICLFCFRSKNDSDLRVHVRACVRTLHFDALFFRTSVHKSKLTDEQWDRILEHLVKAWKQPVVHDTKIGWWITSLATFAYPTLQKICADGGYRGSFVYEARLTKTPDRGAHLLIKISHRHTFNLYEHCFLKFILLIAKWLQSSLCGTEEIFLYKCLERNTC